MIFIRLWPGPYFVVESSIVRVYAPSFPSGQQRSRSSIVTVVSSKFPRFSADCYGSFHFQASLPLARGRSPRAKTTGQALTLITLVKLTYIYSQGCKADPIHTRGTNTMSSYAFAYSWDLLLSRATLQPWYCWSRPRGTGNGGGVSARVNRYNSKICPHV